MTLVEGPVGGAAFQKQMIIPQNMLAMMIMAAGGGENTASGDFQNLLNALEEFTGVKLAIVSFSQILDGLQDGCFILVVEELVQVPGPVEGLGIDH